MSEWFIQFLARNETEVIASVAGLLGVFLGGFFTLAGSLISPLIELRLARKRRMEDEIAARRISANAEAYKQVKEIVSLVPVLMPDQLEEWATKTNVWFLDHRLFLPGKFPTYWIAMRKVIHDMDRLYKRSSFKDEEMENLIRMAEDYGAKALNEITKDLNLNHIGKNNP